MWIYFNIRYDEKTAAYAPTILTTTGILATFVGIALGLLDLDPKDIQGSLPQLLGGLKTAFFASVAGVSGALTIKLRHYFIGIRHAAAGTGADGEVTAADLAALLKGIQHALVGNDEATLVSQLKLLRLDTNERLEALRKAQIEALQKLSEMGSASLVEALRDVIRDFNAKLTEQFGENFKQLNDAVGKLLVWQEQYKDHIATFTQRQTEIAGSMRQSTSDYNELVAKSGVFTKTAQDLSGLLTALETQKQQLVSVLTELAKLLQAASGSLPQIESKLTTLTNQLADAVTNSQKQLSKALVDSSTAMESTVQQVAKGLSTAVTEQQKEVNKALTDNVLLIRNSIQSVNQDFTKINQTFNQQLSDLAAKTKDQVSVLDKALSDELQKSLESLGRQLTALSERFAEHYGPLADKLRQMLNSLGADT
jgi:DNA anti-recombination protein RmuC